MKKVLYIKTCSTCIRIIKGLNLSPDFTLQDIKADPLKVSDLQKLVILSGSYESLFSRRAKLYKEMGLKNMELSEKDYKHYILEHYTFLKRPVIVIDDKIFIGNSQKNIKAAQLELEKL